jgi:hypothetical protein
MFEPHVPPQPDRENDVRSTGARIEIRPSARVVHLAERSLACPECGVPIRLSGPVGWHEPIVCAFCETGLRPGSSSAIRDGPRST